MWALTSPVPRAKVSPWTWNGTFPMEWDDHPQTLPGFDDSLLGRDVGAALVPKDFGKDLRQRQATGASSPFARLGNVPVVERKQKA